jgi:hypothetical protein
MANRGRPRKVDLNNVEDAQFEETNDYQDDASPISEPISREDNIGEGTFGDYNPFDESVVERDYSTPKTASGLVEDIDEPTFVPPSYEDIVSEREQQTDESFQQQNPFNDPNPAMNDLSDRDKKIACESLVDTVLDAYEQLHKYAQFVVKVDEEELMQKQAENKIDLSQVIPVTENGDTMTVGEFVGQFNQQSQEALKYDKEFGYKVRPAMIRVFMKRGWGMTDEQYLLYMFGKDIAVKVSIMYQLKKTINNTLEVLEKAHRRNRGGNTEVYESNTQSEIIEDDYEEEDLSMFEDINTYSSTQEPVQNESMMDSFTQNMNINMPNNPKDAMSQHPKEVRNVLRKSKNKGNAESE